MSARGYQHNFSRMVDGAMYDHQDRERKAKTMLAILFDYFDPVPLNSLHLLDVGSSTGIIANYLADHFLKVIGIDIDNEAIGFATETFQKPNLKFEMDDLMGLSIPDETFEVIICTQIYEHVPDAQKMIKEIFRILKSGGVCYFAAGNRITLMEPHYRLPFLSILPVPLAHLYMKLAGKGNHYHEKHLCLPGLKKLVNRFIVHDYTKKIIEDPKKFSTDYMLMPGSMKHKMGKLIVKYAYWLCPTYIWILEKPNMH